ncbi:MAG: DNA polymerase III subunit alpha [Mycoplasmoidaceae bacterium]
MKIANINTKSHYSLLKSNLTIPQIISHALENKQTHVFLADNNLYGSIEFIKEAHKNNIIPIIGLELIYQKKEILIFPKTNFGYQNIINISSFYLQNIDFDINKYSQDILFFSKEKIDFLINKDHVYENYQDFYSINQCNYKFDDEYKIIQVMDAIKNEKKMSFSDLKSNSKYKLLEMSEFTNKYSQEIINRTVSLFSENNLYLSLKNTSFLKFNNDSEENKKSLILSICKDNLLKILNVNFLPKEYDIRLNYELNVIHEKGYNDYFLIVHDIVTEAENRGILIGPGRGSAAGSLISYGLKITLVDPIKYHLVFERFLNPNRLTMPDIDIDIMDSRRDELIEYLFEKYGHDKVAQIITFQRIKAKMALRDVGRVFGIDLRIANRLTKMLSNEYDLKLLEGINSKKEMKDIYNEYPFWIEISSKLIGIPRQTGKHAAGVILSNDILTDIIPIQQDSSGINVTQISMDYLEELGLIKLDLLGLSNLTIIKKVMKIIKSFTKIDIDLRMIPLNNLNVYKAISDGRTLGIFQLESPGMRSTLMKIKPRNIEDISIVSALYRPGPQNNIKSFINRREGKEKITYVDERLKEVLESTNGIIIYQEQVIQIVQVVANFSASEADIFRNAISKKYEKTVKSLKIKFIEGAISNNYSEKDAINIFAYIEKFALYGFNHSHSISYALISYWMMYFKIYYPIEFYSVTLSSFEGSQEKISAYCNEIKTSGIIINQPNINLSSRNFIINKSQIYFGFSSIKGIGAEICKKIINVRSRYEKFISFEHAICSLGNNGIGISTFQILIKSGCFDEFNNRLYCLNNLKSFYDLRASLKEDMTLLFQPREIINDKITKENDIYFSKEQFNLIGYSFFDDSLNDDIFSKISKKISNINLVKLNNLEIGYNNVIIKISNFQKKIAKNGKEMIIVDIVDNSKTEKVYCFNCNKIESLIKNGSILIAKIKKGERWIQLINLIEINNNEDEK